MRLRYFAWVRERIGKGDEELTPPESVVSVADLIDWLRMRDDGYAHAFADAGAIRASIDKLHVKHDVSIAGAKEIAFFPPMTGG